MSNIDKQNEIWTSIACLSLSYTVKSQSFIIDLERESLNLYFEEITFHFPLLVNFLNRETILDFPD